MLFRSQSEEHFEKIGLLDRPHARVSRRTLGLADILSCLLVRTNARFGERMLLSFRWTLGLANIRSCFLV